MVILRYAKRSRIQERVCEKRGDVSRACSGAGASGCSGQLPTKECCPVFKVGRRVPRAGSGAVQVCVLFDVVFVIRVCGLDGLPEFGVT